MQIFLALSFLEEVLTNEFDILRVLINERILFLENVTCNNSKGWALKKGFSSVNYNRCRQLLLVFSVVFLRKPNTRPYVLQLLIF